MENGVKLLLLRSFCIHISRSESWMFTLTTFFHSYPNFTCSCMGNSPPKIKSPGLWRILILLSPAMRPEGSRSPTSRSPPSRSPPNIKSLGLWQARRPGGRGLSKKQVRESLKNLLFLWDQACSGKTTQKCDPNKITFVGTKHTTKLHAYNIYKWIMIFAWVFISMISCYFSLQK